MKISYLVACTLPLFGLARASVITHPNEEILVEVVAHERPHHAMSSSNEDVLRYLRASYELNYQEAKAVLLGNFGGK